MCINTMNAIDAYNNMLQKCIELLGNLNVKRYIVKKYSISVDSEVKEIEL